MIIFWSSCSVQVLVELLSASVLGLVGWWQRGLKFSAGWYPRVSSFSGDGELISWVRRAGLWPRHSSFTAVEEPRLLTFQG